MQRADEMITHSSPRDSSWTPRRVFVLSLALLLFFDALLILFHLLRAYLNDTSYEGFLLNDMWSLELEQTYPERFGYLQSGLTALVLFGLYAVRRRLTYLSWALVFLFILFDDSLALHEGFGMYLTDSFALPTVVGLAPEIYAEGLFWLLAGLILLPPLIFSYRDRSTRPFFHRLLAAFLLLLFFAVGVDALHALLDSYGGGRTVSFLLATLEDGGEMVALSFAAAFSLAHLAAVRLGRRYG